MSAGGADAPGALRTGRPPRIVHVSDCFPPRVGGIETQVHDLAAHQAAAGYDVHVLTATAGADGATLAGGAVPPTRGSSRFRRIETLASGVRVHRLASPLTLGFPVTPGERALIARVLRALAPASGSAGPAPDPASATASARTEPDVVVHVHAGVLSPFAFAGVRAAVDAGLPVVVTWHCMLDGVEPLVRAGARTLGWAGGAAPFVATAVSEVAAARVAAALGHDDVAVVPNGLDIGAWRAAADAARGRSDALSGKDADTGTTSVECPPPPPDGPILLVATQRLAPRKRAEDLVRVVLAAHRRLGRDADGTPRVHLTLLGGGPLEGPVRASVAAAGADGVVDVAGRVPRESLPGHYAGAHAFVSPARLEAFGIAALEARSCGLAVLAARGTGPATFLRDGFDAILVGEGRGASDAAVDAALTDAIVGLVEHPDRLRALVTAARRAVPEAGWATVLGACDRAYREADTRRARGDVPPEVR